MTEFRSEHDSLGSVQVPAQALYGAQTQRAIENFRISGRTAHRALIRAYLRLKSAAARANHEAGVLSKEISDLITGAAENLLKRPESEWMSIFPVDPYQAGAGTSQNMNTNEVLANVANQAAGAALGTYKPVHPNDHVNRSQSTNDTFPTVTRLAVLDASRPLVAALEKLSESFATKAAAWMDLPKSARTHLQDAVPITLGQEFSAYAATIAQCAKWLESGREQLRDLGIGGSAVGTGLNVPRGYREKIIPELARLTGERLTLSKNLCQAMQSQAPVLHYSSMLRITAIELTRICNDLRLLASGPMTGLGEITLPAVQPGSSIMPGKVNPSILEMANQTFFAVLGFDQTVALAVQAGQLDLNVMMPIMAHALLEATHLATHSIHALRERCIDGMEANEERLRRYFESTPQVATALSPKIGYEATAALVQEALRTGASVVELVRERKILEESELAKLLDVRSLTGRS